MRTRKNERLDVCIVTAGRLPHADVDVRILDVSETGCRIAADDRKVRTGATIMLGLSDEIEVAGRIMWSEHGQSGVAFYKPISAAIVDRLSGSLPAGRDAADGHFRPLPKAG